MQRDNSAKPWLSTENPGTEQTFRFSHAAMATEFEILINHKEEKYAKQAAHAAFQELDKLELDLSRFIENSDISRINQAVVGQSVIVGPDTIACLAEAALVWKITGGVFDPGAGNMIRDHKSGSPSVEKGQSGGSLQQLQLDLTNHTACKTSALLNIDLGAIGKGFALDRMAAMLREWSVKDFLIHSGQSTVIVFREHEKGEKWKLSISHPDRNEVLAVIELPAGSLSASGMKKGIHIIDPRTGSSAPVNRYAWVFADTAARSDALSTAFMLLPLTEIGKLCRQHREIKACILSEGKLRNYNLIN